VTRFGVDVPIIAGLMPITDYKQIAAFRRFAAADIPAWIRKRMESFANDPPSQKPSARDCHPSSRRPAAPRGAGIHFYTLNKAEATLRIWKNLGLSLPARARPKQPRSPRIALARQHHEALAAHRRPAQRWIGNRDAVAASV